MSQMTAASDELVHDRIVGSLLVFGANRGLQALVAYIALRTGASRSESPTRWSHLAPKSFNESVPRQADFGWGSLGWLGTEWG